MAQTQADQATIVTDIQGMPRRKNDLRRASGDRSSFKVCHMGCGNEHVWPRLLALALHLSALHRVAYAYGAWHDLSSGRAGSLVRRILPIFLRPIEVKTSTKFSCCSFSRFSRGTDV